MQSWSGGFAAVMSPSTISPLVRRATAMSMRIDLWRGLHALRAACMEQAAVCAVF